MKKTRIPNKVSALLRQDDARQVLSDVGDIADSVESIIIVTRRADGTVSLRFHGSIPEMIGLCDLAISALIGKANELGGIDDE